MSKNLIFIAIILQPQSNDTVAINTVYVLTTQTLNAWQHRKGQTDKQKRAHGWRHRVLWHSSSAYRISQNTRLASLPLRRILYLKPWRSWSHWLIFIIAYVCGKTAIVDYASFLSPSRGTKRNQTWVLKMDMKGYINWFVFITFRMIIQSCISFIMPYSTEGDIRNSCFSRI